MIELRPPLRCRLAGDAPLSEAGEVFAIAPDRMLLRGLPLRMTRSVKLVVELTSSQSVEFPEVTIVPGADATSTVDVRQHAEKMTDLLARIRKDQHIEICAHQDVEASDRSTGFEHIELAPVALPRASWRDLSTTTSFLGREFALPMLITGMTGGIEKGAMINRRLAKAAAAMDIPMGVGSQRLALDNPEHRSIFAVKDQAPGVFLIGNMGCAQVAQAASAEEALAQARAACEMIDADALAIHLNILQESVQVEGDRFFDRFCDRLHAIAQGLGLPVVVKEVGVGIDSVSAETLRELGVAAIDVGGKGGTSWSLIEGLRSSSRKTKTIARTFRDFGLPTAVSLQLVHAAVNDLPLIATGGMRSGLMVAKAVGLGARMVGLGLPLFRAALESEDGPTEVLDIYADELRVAMMVSGCRDLQDLSSRLRPSVRFQELVKQWNGEI